MIRKLNSGVEKRENTDAECKEQADLLTYY